MQDLALLIQLFGRETMERLSGAGFGTPRSIVRAGPERLAAEGGVDLPLACRIVSAALEAMAADDLAAGASVAAVLAEDGVMAPDPMAPDLVAIAAATPGVAVRDVITPGATAPGVPAPGSPPAPRRAARMERKPRTPIPERPAGRPHKPDAESLASPPQGARVLAPDGEALIDDVGLVSWMGFSSRAGTGRAMSFSVSDAILDGGPPAVASPGDRQPAGATKEAGRAAAAPARTIEGSFWSFGGRPAEEVRAPVLRPAAGRPEENSAVKHMRRATDGVAGSPAGHGVPRRRRHDEQ